MEVSIGIRFKEEKIDQSTRTGENVKLQHLDLEKQTFNEPEDLLLPTYIDLDFLR